MMKWSLFLFIISIFQAQAISGYAQKTELSLDFKSTSIEKILNEIENQSDFYFLYNKNLIDVGRETNIQVENQQIEVILDQLFSESDIGYRIFNRQIVLSAKNNPTVEFTSQVKDVSGKVTDSSGEPLPGVTVIVKGTTKGTVTDFDGNYTISDVQGNETLVFSFVGMSMQEIAVANQSTISVMMTEDAIGIEEVVAIGYGSVKKKDLTGSVGSVDAEAIMARGTTGVLESMQGAIAGVNISQTSSRPGAALDIQIRGQNTLNDDANPPLYVVDGIVTNDINFLNPSDIAKIDILKDASSTAIYGSRGSNGVVLVTTKNAGEVREGKTTVSYNGVYGIKSPARMPTFFSSRNWFEYRSHAYLQYNPGNGNNGMTDWTMNLEGVYMANPEAARRAYEQDDTDWLDAITQNGMQQNHYVNVAGNTGKMSFNVGMGYQDEDGIWVKENLKRHNIKLSFSYQINDKWQVGATTNLSQTEIESGNSTAYRQALRMSPVLKIYDDNGDLLIQPGLAENMGGVGNNFTGNTNPVWEIENGSDNTRRQDVLASAFLQFSPTKGLDIKTIIQPKFNKNRLGRYTEMVNNISQRTGTSNNTEAFDYTWDNIISYEKSFDQIHNFKVTGIHSVYSSRIEALNVRTQELPYNSGWYNLFSGNLVTNNSSSRYSEVKMVSYLGSADFLRGARVGYWNQQKVFIK